MIGHSAQRNVRGVGGAPGLPLVVLSNVQEQGAVANEGERFGDIDIAKFGHGATFRERQSTLCANS